MKEKKIIVTADDLGIDIPVNQGILESFKKGVLTSTALLVNTPETEHGVAIVKKLDDLEIGLHLSIVEGVSLAGQESSVTDTENYFKNELCLIRHWKDFLKKYFLRRISLKDLEIELELQFKRFLDYFDNIPFLNGTQHLHILPGVIDIVLKLALKYNVKAIRLPSIEKPSVLYLNKRLPVLVPFQILGSIAKLKARKKNISSPDAVLGMQYSGKINERLFLKMLKNLPAETNEIVMHPGYESLYLRKNLPWGYSDFDWEIERNTLTSDKIKKCIKENKIKLINFQSLK